MGSVVRASDDHNVCAVQEIRRLACRTRQSTQFSVLPAKRAMLNATYLNYTIELEHGRLFIGLHQVTLEKTCAGVFRAPEKEARTGASELARSNSAMKEHITTILRENGSDH